MKLEGDKIYLSADDVIFLYNYFEICINTLSNI